LLNHIGQRMLLIIGATNITGATTSLLGQINKYV